MTVRFAVARAKSSATRERGAPGRSAPRILENRANSWRIGAFAVSPSAAVVVVRELASTVREAWLVAPGSCASSAEAALYAIAEGIEHARHRCARRITLVIFDTTLAGYCWRGWRPRSLRMHQALTALLVAAGSIDLKFEDRTRRAHATASRTPLQFTKETTT